jgi:RNA polymerase sigma-70 factor, ECF subfamily
MNVSRGAVDNLLLTRAVDDPLIIEAMVRDYRDPIFRLVLSILNDPDEAEDAVQDVFVNAASALNRYQVGTSFKSWLFTIAVNISRDYLRKRAARSKMHQVWKVTQSFPTQKSDLETSVIQNESRKLLWGLVDHLNEKHRLVVILRLVHDLSIMEISQILDVHEKTVYSRLYDAFKKLRIRIKSSPELEKLWKEFQI